MDKEAAVLVVNNIAMLEDAANLVNEVYELVEETVWNEIEELASRVGFLSLGDQWACAPKVWCVGDDQSFLAKYIWALSGGDDFNFDLTNFLSEKSGRHGFRFELEYKYLASATRGSWKKFAREANEKYSKLQELGFEFEADGGTWFIPWKISADQVAKDLLNDNFDKSLQPIRECFAMVIEAQPMFEQIVDEARHKFSGEQQ